MKKTIPGKIFLLSFFSILLFTCKSNTVEENNKALIDFENKAKKLVAQMTLEEKVSQMSHESPAIERLNIPEYNWWNECLHGVGRAGKATVFP